MKRKGKKRGPYKCTRCKDYGHRADKCTNAHKFETLLNSLPGDEALARLVPEPVQIVTVLEGEVGNALAGAIRGNERLAEREIPRNASMINAWTELSSRAARIPAAQLVAARRAREALRAAEQTYAQALTPIRVALKLEAPRKARRS